MKPLLLMSLEVVVDADQDADADMGAGAGWGRPDGVSLAGGYFIRPDASKCSVRSMLLLYLE